MKPNRFISIELYRTCLMFGICLFHCVSQGGHDTAWLSNLLSPCVCGFVFVSGWFGIRFSVKKVFRLYGMAAYAAGLCVLYVYMTEHSGGKDLLRLFVRLFRDYWFLNAYVLLMCFTPMIEAVLSHVGRQEALRVFAPVLAVVYGWSWLGGLLPYICHVTPRTPGLGGYTGMTLMACYITARLCRLFCMDTAFWRTLCLVACAGIAVCWLGGEYHSPLSLLFAGSVFYLFKRIECPPFLGRVLAVLNPSLFVIYLLHSRGAVGFPIIARYENWLLDKGLRLPVVYIVASISVFVLCFILDIPRRLALAMIARDSKRE